MLDDHDFCWKLLTGMGVGIIAVAGVFMWALRGWLREKDKRLLDHVDARRIIAGGE